MSTKIKKYRAITIAATILLVFMLLCFGGSALLVDKTAVAISYNSQQTIKSEYLQGETLNIPSAKLTYKDKSYDAVPVLYFPDGAMTAKTNVLLSSAGLYSVEYRVLLESGKLISERVDFTVKGELYSVVGEKCSLRYGSHEYAPDVNGIVVSLTDGGIFKYNKIIDLNGKTANDSIIKLFVTPNTIGTADATKLIVKFTDVYNPENVVTVTGKDPSSYGIGYDPLVCVTVNAAGQFPVGVDNWYPDGTYSGIFINDKWGTYGEFSMVGKPRYWNDDDCKIGDRLFTISWDLEEKAVYGTEAPNHDWYPLVSDLDDTKYQTNPWGGFTTGEVYMTVEAESYQASNFNMVITHIADQDISKMNMVDSQAPTLSVDKSAYGDKELQAIVGKPFKLFNATAFDKYQGSVEVQSAVYLNYGTASQSICKIDNGYFTPQRKGVYTIKYFASDNYGNKAEELVEINVKGSSTFQASIEGKVSAGQVGKNISVASSVILANGIGVTDYSITAKLQGGDVSYEIDKNTLTFKPMYTGVYDVVYTYKDYVETKVITERLEVVFGDKPALITDAVFPEILVSGAAYELPILKGYEFSDGSPKEIDVVISVKEDGGNERTLDDNRYTVTAHSSTQIIYKTQYKGNTDSYTLTLPVQDVSFTGDVKMQNYFYKTEGSITNTAAKNGVSITTSENLSAAKYVNMLSAVEFTLDFNVSGERNNFDSVNVYLRDSVDSNIALKLSYFKKDKTSSNFRLNDRGFLYSSEGNFFGVGTDYFTLSYDNGTKVVSPTSNTSITVTADLNGNEFKGFPSNKIYLEIEFEGVAGESEIIIKRICNQPFSEQTKDLIAPILVVNATRGDRYVGDVLTLSPAYACDILDPCTTFYMYVQAPDRSYAVSNDGVRLDEKCSPERAYSIALNQVGKYLIYYYAEDSFGNYSDYAYVVNVMDKVTIEVTLKNIVSEAKLNDKVKVADIVLPEGTEAWIFIQTPSGVMYEVGESKTFVAQTSGEYTVHYFVYDADRNCAYKYYTVTVS